MNLWDVHMHTHHSGDSKAPVEDMVQSAIEHGLRGICFTDHLDYDYPPDAMLFVPDMDAYYREILKTQEKHGDTFPIRWGIELGLSPSVVEKNNAILAKYPFDFVIGSSHVCHGLDPYYPQFYEGRTEDEAYREYFESVLENAKSPADFDVYGHIDYVVRYGPNKDAFFSYRKYADVIDEILRVLISRGKGIEINTGGFAKGLQHPNPTEDIIKRYHELGGEIITTGADAHTPQMVAYRFEKLEAILSEAGFRYYTVFRNRVPEFIRI